MATSRKFNIRSYIPIGKVNSFKEGLNGEDTLVISSTLTNWKNWTASRSGHISISNGEVIFKVMNRNWDNRKWRCRVYNNIGEVYSKQYKIRVKQ